MINDQNFFFFIKLMNIWKEYYNLLIIHSFIFTYIINKYLFNMLIIHTLIYLFNGIYIFLGWMINQPLHLNQTILFFYLIKLNDLYNIYIGFTMYYLIRISINRI